jgi:hypothetical protein
VRCASSEAKPFKLEARCHSASREVTGFILSAAAFLKRQRRFKLSYIQHFFIFVLTLGLILFNYKSFIVENLYIMVDSQDYLIFSGIPLIWKDKLQVHYKKHHKIVKFIQESKEPSVEFLNQILEF